MRQLFVWLLFLLLTPQAWAGEERWQKVAQSGQTLAVLDGPWSCVRDLQTGLLWENKSDNEGRRFNAATYSWHDPERRVGRAAQGSCVRPDATVYGCDTHEYVQLARQERWCGVADWRLPTASELSSLLHDTGFVGAPLIATGYFPHTGRYPYWTSDLRLDAHGRYEAQLVNFGTGEKVWLPLDRVARLRLVSGRQP